MSVATEFYRMCTTYLVHASYMEQESRFESGARELETGSDNKGVYRLLIRKNKKSKKNHKFHMEEAWEGLQAILAEFNAAEEGVIKRLAMGKYQTILESRRE